MSLDLDTRVKLAVYHFFATEARAPAPSALAPRLAIPVADVEAAFARLRQNRVLWLEAGGETIRMAPPFSGIPTQHRVAVAGKQYFANCAWDALGIPAALKTAGTAYSRCEQSGEPLVLEVRLDAPPDSDWLFHCLVPAAQWWKDLPFT